jgi:putative NADPH-quinone reductase
MDTNPTALVVIGHPNPNSFNHALAGVVTAAWQREGITTTVSDLYQIGFNPIATASEAAGAPTIDPVVLDQIAMLKSAVLVAIVHPNWWGAPPAIVKGWIDRVFAPSAAYMFPKGADDGEPPTPLLVGKWALVLNTTNTSSDRETMVFGDPLARMWRDCVLSYCGFTGVERRVFGVVATSSLANRESWIRQAEVAAKSLLRMAGQG